MITRLDLHQDQAGAWDVISNATGNLAFDIGANIGQSTKVLANGFKKVVAFEPCQESFEILATEMPFNVSPVQLAVSSVDGRVELEEHAYSISTGQLTAGDGLSWGKKVGTRLVTARKLDQLVMDWGYPDFVKIDTEGSEVEIVRGGISTLTDMPSFIIEVHRAENEQVIRDLLPHRDFKKLTHHPSIAPRLRRDHFWLVSR